MLGRTDEQKLLWVLLGLGIGFGAYIWGVYSIRCPACRAKLLWKAMRERTPDDWFAWLNNLRVCPVCGDGTDDQ